MARVRNRLFVLFLNTVLCACAAGVLTENHASAQTGYLTTSDPRLQYVPPTPTLEELQLEYDSIRLWGPAVGVPVSYVVMAGGFATVVGANFDLCLSESCVDEPWTRSQKAWTATGSVMMAAGLAGFIMSIVRIVQKRERKRKLRYEMDQLHFGS